jgi:hypothetical protein
MLGHGATFLYIIHVVQSKKLYAWEICGTLKQETRGDTIATCGIPAMA